mgnify:CR=1 FL=1
MNFTGIVINMIGWTVIALFAWQRMQQKDKQPVYADHSKERIYRLQMGAELRLRELLVLGTIFFLIPFAVHLPYLLSGDSLVDGDGVLYIYNQKFLKDSLASMDFPLWCPYLAAGRPWAGDMSVSALYPLNWICAFLPQSIQLASFFGMHYVIGGVGLLKYFGRIGIRKDVSISVAFIYLFTVHMGGARKEHVLLIATALYVPLILYLLESYFTACDLRWLLGASVAMALQFYLGFLQYVVYSDLFVGCYLLFSGIRNRVKIRQILTHGFMWLMSYFLLLTASLLPITQLYYLLSSSGGASPSYDSFVSWSLHPIKLIMSVFPQIFGSDVWAGLIDQGNYTSGMDAELVIGGALLSVFLSGIFLIKKSFHVKFMLIANTIAFLFACMGNIEPVGRFFYRVPIINLFRVPSRSLFLCTFSIVVIAAIALNEVVVNPGFISKVNLINGIMLAAFSLIVIYYYGTSSHWFPIERYPFTSVFLRPFIWFAVFMLCCITLHAAEKCSKSQAVSLVFLLVISLSTIAQMFPYYKYTYYSKPNATDFSTELGTSKVWSPDGAVHSLTLNSGLTNGILSINSYNNLNLPYCYQYIAGAAEVPMNYSGLYRWFFGWMDTVSAKNNFLSMLGVRYLAVSPQTGETAFQYLTNFETVGTIMNEQVAAPLIKADGYQYYAAPVTIEENAAYRVVVTLTSESYGDAFYVDFSCIGYDNAEQEQWFTLNKGTDSYEAFLPSGDFPPKEGVLFRVISLAEYSVEVESVLIEKINPVYSSDYCLVERTEEYALYENRNAKDLLFSVSSVQYIPEDEKKDMYLHTASYDILNTSYIVGKETPRDLDAKSVDISNITLSNNRVSAEVCSDGNTFINMTQCYYPGWVAYVDGEKTTVYEVNGIIQGAFVPAGQHLIEFCYQPVIFYAGACITCLTLLAIFVVSIYKKEKLAPEIKGRM